MGLFDRLRGNKKKEADKERTQKEEIWNTQGWDAITRECERVYPGQKNPKHYGTVINWWLGGNDPLDGISIYDGGDYWHFVTYGLSELYEKESENPDVSGYGMEFTLKLKKESCKDEEMEIRCMCGILQTIARITFTKGEIFRPYEYLYTGQTQGIDSRMESGITGFLTIPDSSLQAIETPNGRVEFTEFIGATDAELLAVKNRETDVKGLYEKLGSDVTDYYRNSVV
ncbi:MAG TPA: suppressor of fused domain protein [Candidatus Bariatricus faecipullorum]|nr:suppressor of fused domain protein [Candidatus Bariatricus faecipullorum]